MMTKPNIHPADLQELQEAWRALKKAETIAREAALRLEEIMHKYGAEGEALWEAAAGERRLSFYKALRKDLEDAQH